MDVGPFAITFTPLPCRNRKERRIFKRAYRQVKNEARRLGLAIRYRVSFTRILTEKPSVILDEVKLDKPIKELERD